jgi:hypothetical protein
METDMTYQITGLNPNDFAPLFELDEAELSARGARRVTATADRGFPCRVSLEDAKAGETLILLHHTSHDVATPFRSAYAIYVRESANEAARFEDQAPPVFDGRPLGLRAFDSEGMLRDAALALRGLFSNPDIAYIDAHNAAHGCFVARVERK